MVWGAGANLHSRLYSFKLNDAYFNMERIRWLEMLRMSKLQRCSCSSHSGDIS
jgi:hypothetical protein